MSITQPSGPGQRPARKLDVAQVSLSLQDRLGLAKVRYERARRLRIDPHTHKPHSRRPGPADGADMISDTASELSDNRYDTPLASSPLPAPILAKELPRSTRSRHAATFNPKSLAELSGGSRKRIRSDSLADYPAKAPRLSWKVNHGLPQSSPTFTRQVPTYRDSHPSFVSESDTIAEEGVEEEDDSPMLNQRSDEEIAHFRPRISRPEISSSMISSSPPRTPPPNRNRAVRNGKATQTGEDGADLLLYLANSPTPANFGTKPPPTTGDYLPSTPPSRYAALPSLISTPGGGMTANFGTPNQQFNFADFVNVTPSPAQLPWGSKTPGTVSRTPRPATQLRKRLNFDALVPPSAGSPSTREKKAGSALQLGAELRH
ncbi:hypothetical protein AJ80_04322 [Polytolypa hystricis UAMH7299]|uniref:Uncharacterized protein n=1 Tax=Polytolypa hystricis (strain UAMH7299) TaxID=1447883 RepID=A0A2B7YCY9_POLH7|nr:hypothetical protein AJ80_04322 [Polytolypa hystricis UAMH7299]